MSFQIIDEGNDGPIVGTPTQHNYSHSFTIESMWNYLYFKLMALVYSVGDTLANATEWLQRIDKLLVCELCLWAVALTTLIYAITYIWRTPNGRIKDIAYSVPVAHIADNH